MIKFYVYTDGRDIQALIDTLLQNFEGEYIAPAHIYLRVNNLYDLQEVATLANKHGYYVRVSYRSFALYPNGE